MQDTITDNLYNYPKYYDLVFGSDWAAEYHFFRACFEKHAKRKVQRLLEPACGTGRLLIRMAEAGYEVAGLDLNPLAVEFCNQRFERKGRELAAIVGDMADFSPRDFGSSRKFDAAFNPINSFRHLPNEATAQAHLQCMADALAKGGIYILGLHLTPTNGPRVEDEAWSASRGHLTVNSYMWSEALDLKQRNERVGMTFDIYTPTRQFRIVDEMDYRTYTADQMNQLFAKVPALEVVATYDFTYDVKSPITIDESTEDTIFVLRKR
ncbi:MAG: methyltransferase domain-containing protein [Planctomycetaceae bacterium]|nr:methyltransferase domain-containing protein [Planctomycetaceae bacterium]